MNIKQILIMLVGAALIALLAYLSNSGAGIQPDEIPVILVAGAALVAAIGGLVWAYRDISK